MRVRAEITAVAVLAIAMIAAMTVTAARTAAQDQTKGSANDAASKIEQGDKLFHAKCGYCHLQGGTGTIMLGFRLGKDKALLEDRTDLKADYIKHVARSGIGSMPRLTRIEVPDSELNLIAVYLTRPASARGAAK
jgi:mono/diheme cytochrome c family protein